MKVVIFGLTITSSWGNGHATLWRGLYRAMVARGHTPVFFERDVPYYASQRDLRELPGGKVILYENWDDETISLARRELSDAEVGMVTSYCPDALEATDLMMDSSVRLRTFYDLDTPITLSHLLSGGSVPYIGPRKLQDFDLVFTYTGGRAAELLQSELGARRIAELYGSVDPMAHHRVGKVSQYESDLSYLGTYAADRQSALETLFIEPARQHPLMRFLIGGAQYPVEFPWAPNIYFVRHLPPGEHPAFFSSSRLTLNVTRSAMADMGYCPSGRLFEAAACGTAIISDWWRGLDQFFEPGRELLVCRSAQETADAMALPDEEIARIGAAARERVLQEHTAEHRVRDFERAIESAMANMDCVEA